MNLLIAISSCEEYQINKWNDPLRDTWLHGLPVGSYKIFQGPTTWPSHDVVELNCDDSRQGLIQKFQMKVRWALNRGYDAMFACLADCYARPERFALTGDYVGHVYTHETFGSYVQGGAGMLLTKQAMQVLAVDNEPLLHRDGSAPSFADSGSEDAWAGQVLRQHGILPTHNPGFKIWLNEEGPCQNNTVIASHLSYSGLPDGYRPEYMYQKHREFLGDPLWMPATI